MSRTLLPLGARRTAIDTAIHQLRIARDNLAAAGARQAANAVRRALKSAEGAQRHNALAPYRIVRQRLP